MALWNIRYGLFRCKHGRKSTTYVGKREREKREKEKKQKKQKKHKKNKGRKEEKEEEREEKEKKKRKWEEERSKGELYRSKQERRTRQQAHSIIKIIDPKKHVLM